MHVTYNFISKYDFDEIKLITITLNICIFQ